MTYSVHGQPAGRDPFLDYGIKASKLVLAHVSSLPPAQRRDALRAVLDRIDPKLWAEVEKKGAAYAAAGRPPRDALGRALAASLANGLTSQVVELGRGRAARGPLGLGDTEMQMGMTTINCPTAKTITAHRTYYGVLFSYRTCSGYKVNIGKTTKPTLYKTPLSSTVPHEIAAFMDKQASIEVIGTMKDKVFKVVKVDPPGSDGQYWVTAVFPDTITYRDWKKAPAVAFTLSRDDHRITLSSIWDAIKSYFTVGAELVGKIDDLACAAVNNPVGQIAAGAGAAYAGASPQAAAAGVGIAQSVCGGAPLPPPLPPPATSFPWVPVLALGAGGILIAWGLS